eukprot:RCo010833
MEASSTEVQPTATSLCSPPSSSLASSATSPTSQETSQLTSSPGASPVAGGASSSSQGTSQPEPDAEIEPEPGPCTVFIGGIPARCTLEQFRPFVERFGAVQALKYCVREQSCFSIVQFVSPAGAAAVKRHRVLKFMGRDLNIGDARRTAPKTASLGAQDKPQKQQPQQPPLQQQSQGQSDGRSLTSWPKTSPRACSDLIDDELVAAFESAIGSYLTGSEFIVKDPVRPPPEQPPVPTVAKGSAATVAAQPKAAAPPKTRTEPSAPLDSRTEASPSGSAAARKRPRECGEDELEGSARTSGALSPEHLALASAWFHCGYWTGFHAAKEAKRLERTSCQ